MSLTYPSYVGQLINLMSVASSTDPNFTVFLPGAIDYAEGRCYRDLDLLAVRITDTSVNTVSGARTIALSTAQGYFLVVERLNILTSSGTQRSPCYAVSPSYLDAVYGGVASSNTGLPLVFARTNDTQLMLGPTPDSSYGTEVVGTIRPTPLSSGNSSTWLSQNVPELFVAATMVFAAGYMRDFGAQSDNPQMSQSWEQQYQTLFKSADTDELRKKYQSVAWSNQVPSPTATPPRV